MITRKQDFLKQTHYMVEMEKVMNTQEFSNQEKVEIIECVIEGFKSLREDGVESILGTPNLETRIVELEQQIQQLKSVEEDFVAW